MIRHRRMTGLRRASIGFTLIEVTVILSILVLFASLIVPNLVGMRDASLRREAYSQVYRLAIQAREDAILNGQTYQLGYEDGAGVLTLSRQVADTSQSPSEPPSSSTPQTENLGQVTLPSAIRGTAFQAGGNSVASGQWKLQFFPDGKSDGGSIEITEGSRTQTLLISKDGLPRWIEGSVNGATPDQWPAGDYVHRQ